VIGLAKNQMMFVLDKSHFSAASAIYGFAGLFQIILKFLHVFRPEDIAVHFFQFFHLPGIGLNKGSLRWGTETVETFSEKGDAGKALVLCLKGEQIAATGNLFSVWEPFLLETHLTYKLLNGLNCIKSWAKRGLE
jgi:hypothetical protein